MPRKTTIYIVGPNGVTEAKVDLGKVAGAQVLTKTHYDIDDNFFERFVWVSHNGTPHTVAELNSVHLFNAFKMVFNHIVPPAFRIGTFKYWPDVEGWSAKRKKRALEVLYNELAARDDLPDEIKQQLRDIIANTLTLTAFGLGWLVFGK